MVYYNNVYDNTYGIHIDESSLNQIIGNCVHNNRVGIFLRDGSSLNVIKRNTIIFNRLGINAMNAPYNLIKKNNIMWNFHNACVFYYIWNFLGNGWVNNFWGHLRIFPKLIPSIIGLPHGIILGFEIDWRPALFPHIDFLNTKRAIIKNVETSKNLSWLCYIPKNERDAECHWNKKH